MSAETVSDLAGVLHAECCGSEPGCPRWAKPGSAHRDYYELRAQNLVAELEPKIGIANVVPVVLAVVRELWLVMALVWIRAICGCCHGHGHSCAACGGGTCSGCGGSGTT